MRFAARRTAPLRILSRPQNQSSLYLRGLRTAVDHSTKLGGNFQVSPPHPAPRRGHPLQAGEGMGLLTGGISSTNMPHSGCLWMASKCLCGIFPEFIQRIVIHATVVAKAVWTFLKEPQMSHHTNRHVFLALLPSWPFNAATASAYGN